MRAIPTSWMAKPGVRSGTTKGRTFFAPAASIISTAAAAFVTVAPEEFLRARAAPQVAKPHHVGAARPVGTGHIERARKVGELSHGAAAAPDVVHQVVSQSAARVGESVRILPVGGIEQN